MMQLRTKKTERSTTHQEYPRIVPLILFASEKKQRKKKHPTSNIQQIPQEKQHKHPTPNPFAAPPSI